VIAPEVSPQGDVRPAAAPRGQRLAGAVVLMPVLLYLMALNPHFAPSLYDDILYFFSARSLAETGRFMFDGKYVVDWAPGFPALIALPMLIGIGSVLASKIVVIACAALALPLGYRLLRAERWQHPLLCVLIGALLVESFLVGTRVMSEWPFMAVSFGFLLLLRRIGSREAGWATTIAAGLLLGAASLIRFQGTLLGAAMVAWMWQQRRGGAEDRRRRFAHAVITATIGGALFIAWRAHIHALLQSGAAEAHYHASGFTPEPSVLTPLRLVADTLFLTRQMERLPLGPGAAPVVALVIAAVTGWGLWRRVRSGAWTPADAYGLANVAFFCVYPWACARHFVPVAPILVGWMLEGVEATARPLLPRREGVPRRAATAFAFAWLGLMIAADTSLLVYGNGRMYAALSPLLSRTPHDFYVGYWRDLYDASRWVRDQGATEPLGVLGNEDVKYAYAFSGLRSITLPAAEPVHYILYSPRTTPEVPPPPGTAVARFGSVSIYAGAGARETEPR
jgi:hypothetical protein